MAKKKKWNVTDFTRYFIPTDQGVLVDTEIFSRRKELGEKFWDLLSLMSGVGDERTIEHFELAPDETYLLRRKFDAIRNRLFAAVVARDGQFCRKCGTTEDLTLDHIQPLSGGGISDVSNLQILCRRHNSQKGAR